MEKITEAEMLKRCLEASIHGTVGVFLYENQIKDKDVIGRMEVLKRVTEKCRPKFHFTAEYCYLDLEFQYEKDGDLLSIYHMYGTYLDRWTKAMTSNECSDVKKAYLMVFDVMSTQGETTYRISNMTPIFACKEGTTLKFVFRINNMSFGADSVDFSDIDRELEYEEKVKEEEIEKEHERKLKETALNANGLITENNW